MSTSTTTDPRSRMGLGARLKAAGRALFSGWGGTYASGLGTYSGGSSYWNWPYAYPGSRRDWALEAGDLWRNSAVSIGLGWICRNIVYAMPQVVRPTTDGAGNETDKPVKGHRLTKLLNRPNPFFNRGTLLRAWSMDYAINGEAYFYLGKTGGGRIGELWPLPSYALRPQWTTGGQSYIDHYVYTVNGQRERFELDEIARFLFAPDPANPRMGWTPIKQCLREVVSDNEIATFTSTILGEMGVTMGFLSPKTYEGAEQASLDEDSTAKISSKLKQRIAGDKRGGIPVFDFPVEWTEMGLTPEKLALDKIARIPEARIFAAMGLQAASQGAAVGEGQRSYANQKEFREADTEGCLVPLWFDFEEVVNTDLLPNFSTNESERFCFDLSRVRMLQEDDDARHKRARDNFQAGGITRAEYREKIGEAPDKERDAVFFIPANGQVIPATAEAMQAREERAMQPVPSAPPESSGDAGAANGKVPPQPVGAANGNGKKP